MCSRHNHNKSEICIARLLVLCSRIRLLLRAAPEAQNKERPARFGGDAECGLRQPHDSATVLS